MAEDSRANLEERPLPVLRRAPHSNCNRLRGTRGHHRLCRLAHLVLALHTRSRRLGLLDVGEIEAEAGARARTRPLLLASECVRSLRALEPLAVCAR